MNKYNVTANRIDQGSKVNKQVWIGLIFHDDNNKIITAWRCSCLLLSTLGGCERFSTQGERFKPQGTRTTPREPDVCTSVMNGIVLGVTPPRALRKMKQDNDCLFNANLMNELMHDHVCYVYASMISCMIKLRARAWGAIRQVQVMYRTSKEYDTDDDLRFPLIVSCHDYVMLGPRYVERILGNAVLDSPWPPWHV
jgi:hypothetical protein